MRRALAYLDIAANDDVYGVFAIDLSVDTIQTFTSDKPRLRAAIPGLSVNSDGSNQSSLGLLELNEDILSRPVKAGPDAQTTFLARAICGRSRDLAARIELHRTGIAIAAGELDVPEPDAGGAALLTGQIPLGTVPPGDYVVRLVVRSGSDTAIRESSLRVTSAE